ncbi:unnamed protein product [Spirodela intermedia]|uniref:RRM domain-containing protein n=1 Tax=Spirodela intermedia TaxID=51605 RepID=A0A7I8J149_SPIIN|nr:unnamed protein product [Spirodela intermedia]CAA6663131.1 unnamed protein product [Spirodela intermedia]
MDYPGWWRLFRLLPPREPPAAPRSFMLVVRIVLSSSSRFRLSFRTTEESLTSAFEKFGRLVDVNLVMDRIANRPRGFAFLQYATEEESRMPSKGCMERFIILNSCDSYFFDFFFLDGRVIFVEVAKPRSEMPARKQAPPRLY